MQATRMTCLAAVMLLAGAAATKHRSAPKQEPMQGATDCKHLGEGYVRLPGSDTCIKVGGFIRGDSSIGR